MRSDKEYIEALRTGQESSVREVYGAFRKDVLRYLHSRMTLDDEECADIYADTIVTLCHNVRKEGFELTATLKTYIIAIGKRKALKRLYKKRMAANGAASPMDNETLNRLGDTADDTEEENTADEERHETVMHVLQEMGESCKTLLEWVYLKQMTYEEILQNTDKFGTVESARVQKSKCLSKAKGYVQKLMQSI